MGYYTRYNLEMEVYRGEAMVANPCGHIVPEGSELCPWCGQPPERSILELVDEYVDANDYWRAIFDGESAKWYEYDEDMRRLSKQFPNVLFTLSGEGDENDDIWRAYYLGGKGHREDAQIVIAEFDERKLR